MKDYTTTVTISCRRIPKVDHPAVPDLKEYTVTCTTCGEATYVGAYPLHQDLILSDFEIQRCKCFADQQDKRSSNHG